MKFSRFGGGDGEFPPGGFCISSFVIARKKDSVLLCKIAQPEIWDERWSLNLDYPERWKGRWQIPSSYLKFGEHPDSAAERVVKDQLQARSTKLSRSLVKSFAAESSSVAGQTHWALCFIYEASLSEDPKLQPWFEDLRYVSLKATLELDFGRGHDMILASLGNPER